MTSLVASYNTKIGLKYLLNVVLYTAKLVCERERARSPVSLSAADKSLLGQPNF